MCVCGGVWGYFGRAFGGVFGGVFVVCWQVFRVKTEENQREQQIDKNNMFLFDCDPMNQ